MELFSSKLKDEVIYLGFDAKKRLATGETISSVLFSITSMTDKDASSMLYGSSEKSGTIVKQKISGGKQGHTYILKASVITSMPQTLVFQGTFKVE